MSARLDSFRSATCISIARELDSLPEAVVDKIIERAQSTITELADAPSGNARVMLFLINALKIHLAAAYGSCREKETTIGCASLIEIMVECMMKAVIGFMDQDFIPTFEKEAKSHRPLGSRSIEISRATWNAIQKKYDLLSRLVGEAEGPSVESEKNGDKGSLTM